METMHLTPNPAIPVSPLSDEDILAMFEAAGLDVAIVDHCDDAGCPTCFEVMPARAA